MKMASAAKTLFLIGGTGRLGQEVAKGLVTCESFAQRVALVRPTSASSPAAKALEQMGWTVSPMDDFTDSSKLQTHFGAAGAVVSTLSGPDTAKVEKAVIDALEPTSAIFVPSQFGVDFRRWNAGSFFLVNSKKSVLEYADAKGVKTLKVLVGAFSDAIFNIFTNLKEMTATVIGDGNQKFSFTRRSDIGYVLAKALGDPDYKDGGFLTMYGSTMSWNEALALVETIKGKKYTISSITCEEAQKKQDEFMAAGNIGGAVGMHLAGEAARGSTGFDQSVNGPNNKYGIPMETLETTLREVLPKSEGGYVR